VDHQLPALGGSPVDARHRGNVLVLPGAAGTGGVDECHDLLTVSGGPPEAFLQRKQLFVAWTPHSPIARNVTRGRIAGTRGGYPASTEAFPPSPLTYVGHRGRRGKEEGMDRTDVDALIVRAQEACTAAETLLDDRRAEASLRMELQLEREEATFRRRVLSQRGSRLAADASSDHHTQRS
jgi:hypothetical protein